MFLLMFFLMIFLMFLGMFLWIDELITLKSDSGLAEGEYRLYLYSGLLVDVS